MIGWRTVGAAACLALMLVSYWGAYRHGRDTMDAEWQGRWAARDAGDKQAWALAELQARQEEQRRATAQEEVRARAQELRTTADAGVIGADAAGQRLRDEAASLAATVSCPATDTDAIARGQAATRAAMVLSDLLARADARAGELAAAYDRARIAGELCQAEHDTLRKNTGNVSYGASGLSIFP